VRNKRRVRAEEKVLKGKNRGSRRRRWRPEGKDEGGAARMDCDVTGLCSCIVGKKKGARGMSCPVQRSKGQKKTSKGKKMVRRWVKSKKGAKQQDLRDNFIFNGEEESSQ